MLEIIKIMDYFTIANIGAKLGGYKALLEPLLVATFPFFTLSYLVKLSRIIKQTRMKEYLQHLKDTVYPIYFTLRDDKDL